MAEIMNNAEEVFDSESITSEQIELLINKSNIAVPDGPQEHCQLFLNAQIHLLQFLLTCDNITAEQTATCQSRINWIQNKLDQME